MGYPTRTIKPPSLCPRCGSPMMEVKDDEGTVMGKRCPACYYATGAGAVKKSGVKISMDETKKKEDVKFKLFNVSQDDLVPTSELSSDNVCIVLDREKNTIYIWKGKYTSPGERYRAGTAATRVKSSERMYGASTVIVDEGDEPKDFPDLLKLKSQIAEEETIRKAEEAQRIAEVEAKQKAEEEAKLKTEEEARLKAEEEAKLKAEEEAKLKAEEEARLKAEEEEAKLKAEEEEAKLKAEEEAKLKAEEEAKQKAKETPPSEDIRVKSLTIIEGIDVDIAKKLIGIDITSVALLATADPTVLAEKAGLELDKIRGISAKAKSILGL